MKIKFELIIYYLNETTFFITLSSRLFVLIINLSELVFYATMIGLHLDYELDKTYKVLSM